jgi:hypothetical protein
MTVTSKLFSRLSTWSFGFPVSERRVLIKNWWQLLVTLSALFTLASLVLFWNQSQAGYYQHEFRLIDQAKAALYHFYSQEIPDLDPQFAFVNWPVTTNVCEVKLNANSVSEAQLKQQLLAIAQLEQKLAQIESQFLPKTITLKNQSGLGALIQELNSLLVNRKIFYEKKYLLDGHRLNLLQQMQKLCTSTSSELTRDNLQTMLATTEEILKLEGVDTGAINQLRTNLQKLFADLPSDTAQIRRLVQTSFYQIESWDNFVQPYNQAKQQVLNTFLALENWQVNFVAKYPELRQNLVLIKEFSYVSEQ